MLAVACIDCGRPSAKSPCPDCTKARNQGSYYQSRAWRRLSAAAVRAQPVCAVCPSTERLTAHHRIPREQGGPDELSNLLVLCGSHHSEYEAAKRTGRTSLVTRIIDQS